MEHESMKTRPGGVTILRAGAALALVAALAACGGGSGTTATTGGGGCTGDTPYAVGDECFADKETADGIIAARTAAETAITAAQTAATALFGNIADPSQGDIDGLETAIGTAETAIGNLPDDERDAAGERLANARTVLASAKEIRADKDTPDAEITALDNRASKVNAALNLIRDTNGNWSVPSSTSGTGGSSGMAFTNIDNLIKASVALADAIKALDSDGNGKVDGDDASEAQIRELDEYLKDQAEVAELIRIAGRVLFTSAERDSGVMARNIANRVGRDIHSALTADGSDGDSFPDRVFHVASADTTPRDRLVPSAIDAGHKYVTDDGKGETWETILKADVGSTFATRTEAIGGTRDAATKIGRVHGLPISAFSTEGTALGTALANEFATNTAVGGTTPTAYTYKGITGHLWCFRASGCGTSGGDLGAGWYFNPLGVGAVTGEQDGFDTAKLVPDSGRNAYEVEEYSTYGYWITLDNSGDWIFHTASQRSAAGSDNNGGLNAASFEARSADAGTSPNKATYKGEAVGMSARVTGTGDSQNHHSGRFEADVALTATFGASPTLGGTVSGFKGVDGAGETVSGAEWVGSWNVGLDSTPFGLGGVTAGQTSGFPDDGATGRWTADGYGEAGERPAGITGAFDARFTDGAAAGAYATKKE